MLIMPEGLGAARPGTGFLSKYAASLDIALRVGDLLIVVGAAWLAWRLRFSHGSLHGSYPQGAVRAALLTALIFPAWGLYRSWRGAQWRTEVARITFAWSTVALGLLVIDWALKTTGQFSRLWMGIWYLTALALFITTRLVLRTILGYARARGLDVRKVVLVGATQAGAKILKATREHPDMGLSIVGYVATPYDQAHCDDVPCLGSLESYFERLKDDCPDQLWIALPLRAEDDIRRLMDATGDLPTQVRLVPDFFGYELINQHSASVAGVPIITLRGSRVEGHARIVKGIEDRLLALLFLVALSPLMTIIAIAVKLSSPGPVIFRQKRHGLGGREIEVWKFRSMRRHTEEAGRVTQASRDDSRVTRVGRVLRRTSLDELPQLFNVLQGRMSLVGPRPHAVEHNREFGELLKGYMQRHGVKPGMTGLAQVNGLRGETDTIDKLSARVQADIEYIRHWSVWMDLKIILLTPMALFKRTNAY